MSPKIRVEKRWLRGFATGQQWSWWIVWIWAVGQGKGLFPSPLLLWGHSWSCQGPSRIGSSLGTRNSGSPSRVAGQDLVAKAIPPPQTGPGQPGESWEQPQSWASGTSLRTEHGVISGHGVPTALSDSLCPQSLGGCWSWAPATYLQKSGILAGPWHLCPVLHLPASIESVWSDWNKYSKGLAEWLGVWTIQYKRKNWERRFFSGLEKTKKEGESNSTFLPVYLQGITEMKEPGL